MGCFAGARASQMASSFYLDDCFFSAAYSDLFYDGWLPRERKQKLPVLLRHELRSPPHSVDQSKSKGQLRFKRR